MKIEEVLELIHRNGSGQDIVYSFISEDRTNEIELISTIYNYKYNEKEGILSIYVEEEHFSKHNVNLITYPNCKLCISKRYADKTSTMLAEIDCKFLDAKPKHIFVRILNIKYKDDEGQEVKKKIMVN